MHTRIEIPAGDRERSVGEFDPLRENVHDLNLFARFISLFKERPLYSSMYPKGMGSLVSRDTVL